ncbi:hypothetical protein C0995_002324 [Termitomyces sp. Mi166|nr:hypothetical protein C0995_002324 [Termitomyces sp. Mi166\
MPAATPDAELAACMLAYTHSPSKSRSLAAGALQTETDRNLLKEIVVGYEKDSFTQQVQDGIAKESIVGAKLDNSP